jgi:hypothetical protein
VRPHVVERDISLGINEIARVSETTVQLVRGAFQIIDEHRPWNVFLLLVPPGVVPFLLKVLIGRYFGAWMCLSDEDVHEVHLRSPTPMESFQWLN